MRTRIFGLVLVVGVLAQAANAGGDVAYRLETKPFDVEEVAETGEAAPMRIEDRVWAAPGVEESSNSYIDKTSEDVIDRNSQLHIGQVSLFGPSIFSNDVWPLTREMFHHEHEQVFSFVIALQR